MKMIVTVLIVFVFLAGCALFESEEQGEGFILNIDNDSTALSARVSTMNDTLELSTPNSDASEVTAPRAFGPVLRKVAHIDAPVIDGDTLSATYVRVRDNYAYITYHTGGAGISGAFDILRVNNQRKPRLISFASTPEADWNSVEPDYEQEPGNIIRVYLMGDTKKGALLQEFKVKNGQIEGDGRRLWPVGASGNSVVRSGGRLFATTGGSAAGGVFVIDRSELAVEADQRISNMKYGDTDLEDESSRYVALSGGASAELVKFDSTGSIIGSMDYGFSLTPENGKNGVFVSGDTAFVALGDSGVSLVDLGAMSEYTRLRPNVTRASNYVVSDENYVYSANSVEYGLQIQQRNEPNLLVGWRRFPGNANHVSIGDDGYLYLANGTGGVYILKYN
ncbi:MAG: hypothetical protein ACQEQV_09765 [Fibrobacterota bacterium]